MNTINEYGNGPHPDPRRNGATAPTPPADAYVPPVPGTKEYREIEDQLVKLYMRIIYLDAEEEEFPIWTDSTTQLMVMAWTLWKTKRVIDSITGRPLTLRRIAERLCANLHRKLPKNVSGMARQGRQTRRTPVMEFYARQWFVHGISPSTDIQWGPQPVFPKIKRYRGVF